MDCFRAFDEELTWIVEIMKIYYGDLLRERGGDIMIKMKIDVFLMCNDNDDNRCG